jgi:tetratricopeptide (TPR) repeat protein
VHGPAGVENLCAQLEGLSGSLIATEEEVVALARASGLLTMYGDLDRGKQFFRRAEHRLQQFEAPGHITIGWLSWASAWQAQALGELAESLAHDIASLRAFEAAGDLRNLCYARSNVGYANMRLGLFEEAEQYLTLARDTALRLDLRTIASGAAHNLGMVQSLLGKHDAAVETEHDAIALFSTLGSGRGETMSTEYLARIHLMRGDVPKAELAARRARELAGDWQSLVAICCASVARALNARGDHASALKESARAVELLELHGSADGEEHYIVAAYAESLIALGRQSEALGMITDACEALTAAASRITDERMRVAFLERVPEHRTLLALSRAARES